MAKFKVTPELATLLKLNRTRNHVSGRSVAQAIGKSASYVSRLEKGEIKTIQEDELTEILKVLNPGKDFYGEALPDLVSLVRTFPNAQDVLHQLWLTTYDVVLRPIEVPAGLAEYFEGCLAQIDMTPEQLATLINQSLSSPFYEELQPNELVTVELKNVSTLLARSHVDPVQLRGIVERTVTVSSYFELQSITYYLIHNVEFGGKPMTVEMGNQCIHASYEVLAKFGVHSLTHFIGLIGGEIQGTVPSNSSLNELFEESGRQSLGQIGQAIQAMTEYDPVTTSQALDQLTRSLAWDPSFALKVIGLPLSDLGEMSYSLKKQLLEDMEALLDRYQRIPAEKRRLERY